MVRLQRASDWNSIATSTGAFSGEACVFRYVRRAAARAPPTSKELEFTGPCGQTGVAPARLSGEAIPIRGPVGELSTETSFRVLVDNVGWLPSLRLTRIANCTSVKPGGSSALGSLSFIPCRKENAFNPLTTVRSPKNAD